MNSSLPPGSSYEILLFASLRDRAGQQLRVTLPDGASVAQMLQEVARCAPQLEPWLPHVRVAVNCDYVDSARELHIGDEIALLPPVSGGTEKTSTVETDRTWVQVTAEPLHLDAIVARAQEFWKGGAGAVVPFLGIVRDNARGQKVTHLEYYAYEAMAAQEMARIADEASRKWQCTCACAHRTGRLKIGDVSLAIAVAGAHRVETFEACRWIVDEIKQRVPVWKKEFAANGVFWVEDPLEGAPPENGEPAMT
jgi:molybdopterin synthase catalytic subunit